MSDVKINGSRGARYEEVLTQGALELVARLHGELDDTRRDLLLRREERQAELDAGGTLELVGAPEDFTVAPVPDALQDRRVEITGPTTRKMVINALNSGASAFMADFEDANSPYWDNMAGGQVNLAAAVRRTIEHDEANRHYELDDETAVLLVRPRGLHLPERHLLLDGEPVAGAFMDFGLYMHRNAEALLERGAGPFFYIPKLESQLEARLWRDAFVIAEDALGLDRGTIKATVLIETIPAAFAMDAILYELRDHSAGLNAGRWDYIFSTIKRFRSRPEFVLPDRSEVTMTVPFMRAYTELLVKTCHRRGAHAIGGMAAVIQAAVTRRRTARRSRQCAPTRSARQATASTARGWPIPTRCRWRPRPSTRC
jgi:malate synthase